MQQAFPAGRVNHVIFLTDGLPNLGEIELEPLSDLVGQWSDGRARLFTIGVGNDVDQGFLAGLAEDHQGEAFFLSEEGDIETALRDLFESFTFPVLLLEELSFGGRGDPRRSPARGGGPGRRQGAVSGGPLPPGRGIHLERDRSGGGGNPVPGFPPGIHTDRLLGDLIPRLWAHQKVQALEEQIARFGSQQELLDDILALGLDYRLVTRRTSLFAPDEGVEVIRNRGTAGTEDDDGPFTAVNDTRPEGLLAGPRPRPRGRGLGRCHLPAGHAEGAVRRPAGQPEELADFALLGEDLLVVVERAGLGSPLRWATRPAGPAAECPQPVQRFHGDPLPGAGVAGGEEIRLHIYNLSGQVVRVLHADAPRAGEHRITWDGRDQYGRPVASGVYVYSLQTGGWAVHRRMMLLR